MLDRFRGNVPSDDEHALEEINKKIKKLNKRVKKLEKENDSYIRLFKTLYLDYELTPKGALKTTFEICQELLNFVDNVCRKHDITYWLDYGNLIGAVRHDGFIPWDDDMDVGMLRKDFDRFLGIFKQELIDNGLDDIINITIRDKNQHGKILYFLQILLQDETGKIFGGLDVFPYDYVIDSFDNIEEEFEKARKEFMDSFSNGMSYEESMGHCYERLNLSLDEGKYIISGVDGLRARKAAYDFELLDANKILPLSTITFCGRDYPCPNDVDYYLKMIYGDYMDIPKVLRFHNRLNELRKSLDLEEKSSQYYDKLNNANSTLLE